MKSLEQLQDDYYQSLRDHAAAHPVPLPENPEMLLDLATIGVTGAKEKLQIINEKTKEQT